MHKLHYSGPPHQRARASYSLKFAGEASGLSLRCKGPFSPVLKQDFQADAGTEEACPGVYLDQEPCIL